jgi:hypothetical protein
MEALVIASDAQVAVVAGCAPQALKVSNGHYPVLGYVAVELCRAKMLLGLSWHGVAADVGLLSLAATARGPGFHAANMSHAIGVGVLCGPLNFRIGFDIEHATVVFAGWVAWRRACNVRSKSLTQTCRAKHASL